MLYDKRWDHQAQPLWSLDSFISFLETRPARERYNYIDPVNCALAQYLKYHNVAAFIISPHDIPREIENIVHPLGGRWKWTFGRALKRAKRQRVWGRVRAALFG